MSKVVDFLKQHVMAVTTSRVISLAPPRRPARSMTRWVVTAPRFECLNLGLELGEFLPGLLQFKPASLRIDPLTKLPILACPAIVPSVDTPDLPAAFGA